MWSKQSQKVSADISLLEVNNIPYISTITGGSYMVLEKVITFISEQFSVDEEDICEDTTFEELGADEEDIEDLVHVVEGEFEIELHEDEIIRISDVSDLVRIVETAIALAE